MLNNELRNRNHNLRICERHVVLWCLLVTNCQLFFRHVALSLKNQSTTLSVSQSESNESVFDKVYRINSLHGNSTPKQSPHFDYYLSNGLFFLSSSCFRVLIFSAANFYLNAIASATEATRFFACTLISLLLCNSKFCRVR